MNTRVSVTVNGPIHIGHAYTILLNEQLAHNSGGLFHVRFDDAQPYWIQRLGADAMRDLTDGLVRDLEWLGIRADSFTSERDNEWRVRGWTRAICCSRGRDFPQMTGVPAADYEMATYRLTTEPAKAIYPYVPWLTAAKVCWDHSQQITHVVRGDELLSEASLYAFICQSCGWPIPEQIFIPRLKTAGGGELSDISKTVGNWKLCDLREAGWSPDRVRAVLAVSCLKHPCDGWTVENLKEQPALEVGL